MALLAATGASLALGAVKLPLAEVLEILLGKGGSGPNHQIVESLRLPRTVEALVVGAALGTAGAVLQGALANPLASPDVIGVTGGAGFGAILILIAFPAQIALVPVAALFFGLLAAALVFGFAWSGRNRGSTGKIILAGIAMLSLFTAGTTGLLASFPERAPSALFFIAGGLTNAGFSLQGADFPSGMVGILQGALLLCTLAGEVLGRYRIRTSRAKPPSTDAAAPTTDVAADVVLGQA